MKKIVQLTIFSLILSLFAFQQIGLASPLEESKNCESSEKKDWCNVDIVKSYGDIENDEIFNELKEICDSVEDVTANTQCFGQLSALKGVSYCSLSKNSNSCESSFRRFSGVVLVNRLINKVIDEHNLPILNKCITVDYANVQCTYYMIGMYAGVTKTNTFDEAEIDELDISDEAVKAICSDIVYEYNKTFNNFSEFNKCIKYVTAILNNNELCELIGVGEPYYESCLMASLGNPDIVSSMYKPKNVNDLEPSYYLGTCEKLTNEPLREQCLSYYEYICKNDPEFGCPKIEKTSSEKIEDIKTVSVNILKGGSGSLGGGIFSINVSQGVQIAIFLTLVTLLLYSIAHFRKRRNVEVLTEEAMFVEEEEKGILKLVAVIGIFIAINLALFTITKFTSGVALFLSGTVNQFINYGLIIFLAFALRYKKFGALYSNIGFILYIVIGIFLPVLVFTFWPFNSLPAFIIFIILSLNFANLAYLLSGRIKNTSIDEIQYIKRSALFLILLIGITVIGYLVPATGFLINAPMALTIFIPTLRIGFGVAASYALWLVYYFFMLSVIFGVRKWWATTTVILLHIALQLFLLYVFAIASL